jgi:hypothetical protein
MLENLIRENEKPSQLQSQKKIKKHLSRLHHCYDCHINFNSVLK